MGMMQYNRRRSAPVLFKFVPLTPWLSRNRSVGKPPLDFPRRLC